MRLPITCALAALATIAVCAPASAQQWFGSSAVYGGDSQSIAVCTINNVSTTPVYFTYTAIFNSGGFAVTPNQNFCGSTLAAKSSCIISANVVVQGIYGCKVSVTRPASVRGVIQIFDGNGALLQTQQLR